LFLLHVVVVAIADDDNRGGCGVLLLRQSLSSTGCFDWFLAGFLLAVKGSAVSRIGWREGGNKQL